MQAAIAALAQKHGLPVAVAAEFESLFAALAASPRLPPPEPTVPCPPAPETPWFLRPDPSRAPSAPLGLPERYEVLGELGRGGMGVVQRVRDRWLHRVVARKVMHASVSEGVRARFLEEAQTTAQLQHPGIVPVYDVGEDADGRFWFTMKEVQGETLREVILREHRAAPSAPGDRSVGLRRLVTTFQGACRAVGFAHERGVVHRDLKPTNVMVGAHGEVLVVDWGIAKILSAAAPPEREHVVTSRGSVEQTESGSVFGTPAFMSPEQALGAVASIDARSDVYALGAVLYELLSGGSPYRGRAADVLQAVLEGPPPSLRGPAGERGRSTFAVDLTELTEVCERAMSRAPGDRYADGTALAAALQSWLDGSRRRTQALSVVAAAATKAPEAAALRARAAALREEAAAEGAHLAAWQPEEDKAGVWAKEDEAEVLEERAEFADLAEEQLLQASLTHAPDLPEAHAALAERYLAAHAAAESARTSTARPEVLLRQHLGALPEAHPVRRSGFTYLKGDGALTLVTDPPGAEVALFRYVVRNRRLVAMAVRTLGCTPLRSVSLPMGSYLCVIRHPERADVRYPVFLGRGEHWDGVPPEGGEPRAVRLPRPSELGPDDQYVAEGWFWSGGDPAAPNGLPRRRLWVDGQVFRRFPVTNREYLVFLDDLVASGRGEEALRYAPRERAGKAGELGASIYGFDGRRFTIRPDADGDVWDQEFPVLLIDWRGASAFAAWEAARTGRPWTLPTEAAWEKAARGVDGRTYPWGDRYDPSFACTNRSHRGRPMPAVVRSFPVDESVYGIRGLAGNVREWGAEAWQHDGAPVVDGRARPSEPVGLDDGATSRVIRGGSWCAIPGSARVADRVRGDVTLRFSDLGLRLTRASS